MSFHSCHQLPQDQSVVGLCNVDEKTLPSWAQGLINDVQGLRASVIPKWAKGLLADLKDLKEVVKRIHHKKSKLSIPEDVVCTAHEAHISHTEKCKVDIQNLPPGAAKEILALIHQFRDVFATDPKAPKECKGAEHEMVLSKDRVCFSRMECFSLKDPECIERQIPEMLKGGIIRPSTSGYNSNPLLVSKKGGSRRFVVDFRQLNSITVRDSYPLPNPDDIIDNCRDAYFFSQLDLASGYWCIPIAAKDCHRTAFSVPRGKYEFIRMPFGLVNAQATLQRLLDGVVQRLHKQGFTGVEGYVDNIIVRSVTWADHVMTLKALFVELREHNFTLRPDKCEFGFKELDFLGYHLRERM